MTRGKIIFIDKEGKAYSTVEFNGDMYPEGTAGEILERFEEGYFENCQLYKRFVENFNKRNYGYDEDLVAPFYGHQDRVIDVTENWTDYLYIINESSEEWIIKAKEESAVLSECSLGIVRFQKVVNIIHRVIKEYRP